MQLRYLKTVAPAQDMSQGKFHKITAMAFSPNSYRLAVATIDRHVLLFDENGEQKDKFGTKPGSDVSC